MSSIRKKEKEHLQAQKLGITTIALIDTNCDPDEVDLPIPGNDDSIRSIELITSLADAVVSAKAAAGHLRQEETSTDISAAAVKSLRGRRLADEVDCKKALQEANGDEQTAIDLLRKAGKKTMDKRPDRETSTGRVAIYTDMDAPVGAMIELLCESARWRTTTSLSPWRMIWRGNWRRRGPAASGELLDQPSPSDGSTTLLGLRPE